MMLGFHHFAVSTANSERMIEFYTTHLGFQVVLRGGWKRGTPMIDGVVGLRDSAASSTLMRAGNCFLEVFEFDTPRGRPVDPNHPASDHGYSHICLLVKDIDTEYERLRQAGVQFNCPPTPVQESRMIRTTYARDPEGNFFELMEVISEDSPYAMVNATIS